MKPHKASSEGPQHSVLVRQIHVKCAALVSIDIWEFEFLKPQSEDP